MRKMKVAVFGATGVQGHPVLDAALEAGHQVRAVSRDPDSAEERLPGRVEKVYGDYADRDSLVDALDGVEALFFHLPMLPSEAGDAVDNLLEAAHRQGVERIVFSTGAWCGKGMPDIALVDGLRRVSAQVLDSGIDAVVLRPTLYLANLVWPHLLRELRETGRLSYPPLDHHRRISWTATEDQGAIAAACLHADVVGQTLDIASPEPVTGPELCRLLAGVFDREIHFAPETIEEFSNTMTSLSGSAEMGRQIADFYAAIDELPPKGMIVDASRLADQLGVKLTPVSRWVKRRLGRLLDLYG